MRLRDKIEVRFNRTQTWRKEEKEERRG